MTKNGGTPQLSTPFPPIYPNTYKDVLTSSPSFIKLPPPQNPNLHPSLPHYLPSPHFYTTPQNAIHLHFPITSNIKTIANEIVIPTCDIEEVAYRLHLFARIVVVGKGQDEVGGAKDEGVGAGEGGTEGVVFCCEGCVRGGGEGGEGGGEVDG